MCKSKVQERNNEIWWNVYKNYKENKVVYYYLLLLNIVFEILIVFKDKEQKKEFFKNSQKFIEMFRQRIYVQLIGVLCINNNRKIK